MKLARFLYQNEPRWGVVQGDDLFALKGELWGQMAAGERLCSLSEVKLLPPVSPCNKALGLGLTYKDMYREYEMREGKAHRDGPATFMKPANTLVGQGDPIVFHAICRRLIYEAELGVIIGKRASRLTAEQAKGVIGGYTCVNDVTCTEYSLVERPIVSTRFKIADTFLPAGPVVETDLDPQNATVICRVNGREVQRSNTGRDMQWTIAELISWVTGFMTLEPGDMICTGAQGTGRIEVGDIVEVEIPGIGVLHNPVTAPNAERHS